MDQALPLATSHPPAWPLRLLGLADRAVTGLVLAAMAAMVVVVSAQVALRYGLNRSLDWADEIGRLGFVWSVFLAIPLGVREGSHIGIDLLVDKLPAAAGAQLRRAGALLATVLMALIAWAAVRVSLEQWDELMSTVDLSVGWFIVPVAIGAALSALHLLRIAVQGPPAARTGSAE
ncbi:MULTISPECIES: TRAP transporter small permease [Ramlibacter]|uniref:TRAP transporter small permease protein n=1 Tax=Ramlibacter pinisoli TaxID=2682844 RepID=A0A6N8IRH6_9BURK|nr:MULTISPECIES: TRAP transporter small permease [Ramlibacter]MBA2963506.1 TRAP transporter small permease [Ramlibacter sp. CGMCC 1.13660]MVQ28473.1 TRAP transporter small permease subunit [Ramlibacter pinisoli]